MQQPHMPARMWIAVGDSFTAGTGDDPRPGGWLGRIADFRSHAEPGAHLGDVIGCQVPLVTGRADIISAIAGANDLLAPRCDK